MAHICRMTTGIIAGTGGWVGLMVATFTYDWVRTCAYTVAPCLRMDALRVHGLWAECVNLHASYDCSNLDKALDQPAYIQGCRVLMSFACLAGALATPLVLASIPCVCNPKDTSAIDKNGVLGGGVLFIYMALCGVISTIWFPVGAHRDDHLVSLGFSLYVGWVGSALCLVSGAMILFYYRTVTLTPSRPRSFRPRRSA